jgi:hypothetical protein
MVLSSFSRRSPHKAPPHEGLLRWASVVVPPLGRSWAVEGAQEQVDRDTPVSRTPTHVVLHREVEDLAPETHGDT